MGLFEHFPYTNYQDLNLNTLLQRMKELLSSMNELQNLVGGYEDRIRELEDFQKEIENYLDNGILPEAVLKALYNWERKNVPNIIKEAVKNIWFGLDTSGRLIINVPDSWKNIVFKTTGYDIVIGNTELETFGHLVLMEV